MTVGFKTRIYPDKKQAEKLAYYCKIAHDMQNFLVAKFKDKLPSVNRFGIKDYSSQDLISDFNAIIPSKIALGVIMTYSQAVKRFWNKIGNPPKFHKYNPNKQSFYIASRTFKIIKNSINMPFVLGEKLDMSKRILIDMQIIDKQSIKEVIEPRFTCYKNKWYLSGSYKVEEVDKQTNCEYTGLDWGIKNFMTTSKGEFINYPKSVLREFQRINKLKHYRDKKIKNSNNWNKVNAKIKLAYDRLENIKRDFIEQTTTKLCKHSNIAIEELTNAKIKRTKKFIRRMNMISPLYRFVEKLQWKCDKFGTIFKKVDPAYTSKTCSKCGNINKKLKLSYRVYKCSCGNIMDRDVNAAKNLVAMAVCCSQ